MRYVVLFLLGLFVGCEVNARIPNTSHFRTPDTHLDLDRPSDVGLLPPAPKRLPKEVQEQFDAYLMTSPILEVVVVRVVKKVLEVALISAVISLVTDYPLYSVLAILLPIFLVSYPTSRWVVSSYAKRLQTSV